MFASSSEETRQHNTPASSAWAGIVSRMRALAAGHGRKRKLRLCETLSLGEKRFIAVVEYGRQKFLLAGTQQNISLLQRLDEGFTDAEVAALPRSDPE